MLTRPGVTWWTLLLVWLWSSATLLSPRCGLVFYLHGGAMAHGPSRIQMPSSSSSMCSLQTQPKTWWYCLCCPSMLTTPVRHICYLIVVRTEHSNLDLRCVKWPAFTFPHKFHFINPCDTSVFLSASVGVSLCFQTTCRYVRTCTEQNNPMQVYRKWFMGMEAILDWRMSECDVQL